MSSHQIMLSVHCASMLAHAEKLRVFFTQQGYTVFLCNQLVPGVNYRTAICENAAGCQIFIPFMNEGWCLSGECEYEFNIALSNSIKLRTPYILPVLMEDFAVYGKYPAVKGFLTNTHGERAREPDLNDVFWNKLLRTVQSKIPPSPTLPVPKVQPTSPPSPSIPHPVTQHPTPPPAHPIPTAADIRLLISTCLQLIQDVSVIQLVGIEQVLTLLTTVVRPSLVVLERSASITQQHETPLRAMMENLSKIKETASAAKGGQLLHPLGPGDKIGQIVTKLTEVVSDPKKRDQITVQDFIQEQSTVDFWQKNFGPSEYSTKWEQFEHALRKDPRYGFVNDDMLRDLRLRVDHYNTGHVVCHCLSDFVGNEPLHVVLKKYNDKVATSAPAPANQPQVNFPLILWVDDKPLDNEFFVEFANAYDVNVIQVESTSKARQWLVRNAHVLEDRYATKFCIITDNVRQNPNASTALDLNAGEDIIRFVRGRRSQIPVLVFCNDPTYAQYVGKYKNCKVATRGKEVEKFIEDLAMNS